MSAEGNFRKVIVYIDCVICIKGMLRVYLRKYVCSEIITEIWRHLNFLNEIMIQVETKVMPFKQLPPLSRWHVRNFI